MLYMDLLRLHNEISKTKESHELSRDQVVRVESEIRERWSKSNEDEAISMINLMIITPSPLWLEIMAKAKKKEIEHWSLLLNHSDHLYESAAEAIADEDGLVFVKKNRG